MRLIALFCFFLWVQPVVFSQCTVSGKITQENATAPIPGVNVYIPGQNIGVVSDSSGCYRLENLPEGEVYLQYSFIGYKTVIIDTLLKGKEMILNINMQPTVIQAQEVVVTGGLPGSQHENAIKVDLIKRKELASVGSPSFNEALASVPGVQVISKGPGVGKPVIRGLSLTNILVLNNGVRLENYQFSENHPFLIDEFGIDRVEIIKGPASLIYGSGAVGGVINVIREKPAPEGEILGETNLRYFSNTLGWNGDAGIRGSGKNISWGFHSGCKSHADYLDGHSVYVPNTRFNTRTVKGDLGFHNKFGSFNLFYDYHHDKLGMSVEPVFALISNRSKKNNIWYQDLTDHLISSRNSFYPGRFKVNVNTAYEQNNRKLNGSSYTPAYNLVNMTLKTFTYEAKVFLPSNENAEYLVGAQGMIQHNKNAEAPNHIIPDANINDISFFSLLQHYFLNKKIMFQTGLRYDFRNIRVPLYSVNSYRSDSLYQLQLDSIYRNFSGSVGAVWHFNDNFLIRTNIASAFRSPNIAELTQYGMHGVRFEMGNQHLVSQQNYETDLDLHYHSSYATFDVSGFYNKINKYIYLSPTGDTTNEGQKIYCYKQTNAFLYGGEAGIHVHPHPLDWLHLRTTFSYVVGKQDNKAYLPFIPAARLKTEIEIMNKNIGRLQNCYFLVGYERVFSQNHPAMFETSTPGYGLVNAAIGTTLKLGRQKINLSLTGSNILNIVYIDHLSTLKDLHVFNPGRNLRLAINIPFRVK